MHYSKNIVCNLCNKPIIDNGTFSKTHGACHKPCLKEKLAWEKTCFNFKQTTEDIEILTEVQGETTQGMSHAGTGIAKRIDEIVG